jgi:hypothetical protein
VPQSFPTQRDLRSSQRADSLAVDDAVLAAWAAGLNTSDISRLVGEPEALVASRVPRVLERRRAAA